MNSTISKKGLQFIENCYDINLKSYRLTKHSDASPFSYIFAIFNFWSFNQKKFLELNKEIICETLLRNLNQYKKERKLQNFTLIFDKPYLQLLTFTMSCLSIINKKYLIDLEPHTFNLFSSITTKDYLKKIGVFEGKPRSGNLAMFYCIVQIFNKRYLSFSGLRIDEWLELHLKKINKNGFWGNDYLNSYNQYVNGYHQYEIFDYLNISGNFWNKAAKFVYKLRDRHGHFAPYPGGGGCFDYDATFFLTSKYVGMKYKKVLLKLKKSILKDINIDGGFSETKYFRPFNFQRILYLIEHIYSTYPENLFSKIYLILYFSQNKNQRIITHWTKYSRNWDESDLWDTWFRNLTINRINYLLESKNKKSFINFPGIGFHHSFL